MTDKEIEARFLEIDKADLITRLTALGATDQGEKRLDEIIFYDAAQTWHAEGRYVRLRTSGPTTVLTYKQNIAQTIDSAHELEFTVSNSEQAEKFLKILGLEAFRHQEKLRHTLTLNDVTIDIDTWPDIPVYAEFEGPSEKAIRSVAEAVGFDWSEAVFDDARKIIQDRYNIPVGSLKWFTFDRCE